MLQHDHVFTVGKRPNERNILSDASVLASLGVDVHRAARGGDVTYHGPGQTVAYPLVGLRELRDGTGRTFGARRYVETLEDVMIDVCRAFGVRDARGRVPAMTGVWVGDKKIGAVGVAISGGVTAHGLAFNRDPDLSFFRHIVSCGLPDAAPTSLADEMRDETRDRMRRSAGQTAQHRARRLRRSSCRRSSRGSGTTTSPCTGSK